MTDALQVNQLTKEFDKRKRIFSKSSKKIAVTNLNFTISEGESVAFLGRNGAGKSTTIKMLCGILTPTKGSCSIFDSKAGSIEANRKLGLIFGTRSQLWMHLTIKKSLNMMAEIYGISRKEKFKRIDELSEMFEITNLLDQRALTLSLGQRMRCELVASLIHYPKVLLADEPTVGLDIVARNHFRAVMKRWQEEKNMTLLLTSHDCTDVESLCKRCILIDHGTVKYDGWLEGLKGELGNIRRVVITFSDPLINMSILKFIKIDNINNFRWCYEFSIRQLSILSAVNNILATLDERKIVDIQINKIQLEEVINHLYRKRIDEKYALLY